jgi:hypothetical protein
MEMEKFEHTSSWHSGPWISVEPFFRTIHQAIANSPQSTKSSKCQSFCLFFIFQFHLMAETADKLYRRINLRIINIFMMELSTPALYVYDKYGTAVSEAAIDD